AAPVDQAGERIHFTFAAQCLFALLAFADILEGNADAGDKALVVFQWCGNQLCREAEVLSARGDRSGPSFTGQTRLDQVGDIALGTVAGKVVDKTVTNNWSGFAKQGLRRRIGKDDVAASVETDD